MRVECLMRLSKSSILLKYKPYIIEKIIPPLIFTPPRAWPYFNCFTGTIVPLFFTPPLPFHRCDLFDYLRYIPKPYTYIYLHVCMQVGCLMGMSILLFRSDETEDRKHDAGVVLSLCCSLSLLLSLCCSLSAALSASACVCVCVCVCGGGRRLICMRVILSFFLSGGGWYVCV